MDDLPPTSKTVKILGTSIGWALVVLVFALVCAVLTWATATLFRWAF